MSEEQKGNTKFTEEYFESVREGMEFEIYL
jgi:hypothetical protein